MWFLFAKACAYPVEAPGGYRPLGEKHVLVPVVLAAIILSGVAALVLALLVIVYLLRHGLLVLEVDQNLEDENQAYLELNSDEQELFFQSREFLDAHPPISGELTLSQNLAIQEKGVGAFEFHKDQMLTNSDLLIVNKTELNFFKPLECSAISNLPIPLKNEVYYFECKMYLLEEPGDTLVSVGLLTKPYPWFRLPGRHPHSVVYDSDGFRRHNQPFPFKSPAPYPELVEGDVVGVGYRVRSGTVFFTRNGKKVKEQRIGGHVRNFKPGQLFPVVGANNMCLVHVNLGQMGFVFIEANVKKWGYAPLEGTGPAPPAYNKFNRDILLDRLEIDDDDLNERVHDFPPDFWDAEEEADKFSYDAYQEPGLHDERISLTSLAIPNEPPTYEATTEDEGDYDLEEEALGSISANQPGETPNGLAAGKSTTSTYDPVSSVLESHSSSTSIPEAVGPQCDEEPCESHSSP